MKTAVIAPLGLSPPVVTCFVLGIGEKITDLVLLTTENFDVKAGFEVVKIGMGMKFPQTRVHEVVLPFEDVSTTEENLKFMSICAKVIKEERERYGCDRILLNVAGGRKNMCITLSLLGQIMAVDGVYHVVSRDVKVVNQLLEYLREDIRKIYDAKSDEEKLKIYREKERFFNSLLFPSPNEFEIVRIPTLPYPKEYLQRLLLNLLHNIDALSLEEKIMLEKHGILERRGSRFQISDYGRKFVDVLLGRQS
jgi:CRISPR-associated protein Csx14